MTSKTARTKRSSRSKPAAAKPAKAVTNRLTPEQHAARGKTINSRLAKGDTLSQIALDLGIRPNMAHGYVREAEFAADPSLALTAKTPVALFKLVDKERNDVNSAHNSWGWLSTRTGIPEGTLKKQMSDAGYDVSGTNIASARKEARPAKQPRTAKAAGTTGTRTSKGKAKKGARRSRSAANPS